MVMAGACFVLASLVGLAGAAALAAPAPLAPLFARFAIIRPLHELLALAGALCGGAGVILGVAAKLGGDVRGGVTLAGLGAFIAASAAAILSGAGAGREYFAWPAAANVLLIAGVLGLLSEIFRNRRALSARAPEGLWLISFGALFIVWGAAESSFYLAAPLARDLVKDLSLQWHAIDTFFAGLNALLYGCGVLILADKPKPLRGLTLFTVASLSLLFTFGHHHYVSPQPAIFKVLSVGASMLALVSFFRHLAAYKKQQAGALAPDHILWRTTELWTIISILSGVAFAVPQVNLLVHGTNFIVVHAMGSLIGVGVMLIMACGLRLAPASAPIAWGRVTLAAWLVNGALGGLWLALGADGLIEGLGRVHSDYIAYRGWRDIALLGFPVFGLALSIGLGILCIELIRAHAPAAVVARNVSDDLSEAQAVRVRARRRER